MSQGGRKISGGRNEGDVKASATESMFSMKIIGADLVGRRCRRSVEPAYALGFPVGCLGWTGALDCGGFPVDMTIYHVSGSNGA